MDQDVVTVECASARELVDTLRALLLEDRAPEMAARYIFRGQGDASWRLVPSAFRPETTLGYENQRFGRVSNGVPRQTSEQGNAEFIALFEFLRLADEVVLKVPADHKWLQQNPFVNVVGNCDIGTGDWPPEELLESLALAQHHGVPTRLLNFTHDPLIAAFFAAEDPPRGVEQIAVWCIDLEAVTMSEHSRSPVRIVTIPRAGNTNLAAQKGLFVLGRTATGERALEHILGDQARSGAQRGILTTGAPTVRKFCLPICERDVLMEDLRKLGVDHAHLMPSFDGVVKELKVRSKLQPAFAKVGEST